MSRSGTLTAEQIHGFTSSLLMRNFDQPQPTPECHIEWWKLVTLPERKVAIAAPRGHAKSTAITHAFVLAALLFRFRDHCMIVSDTEEQACAFLGDIKMELSENDELRELFGINKFIRDKESEVVVLCDDFHKFRVIARGSNQKLRGLKWRNKRPNLIVGDDLENDEMVMSQDRRQKFHNWFLKALLPAGSDDAIFRIVGTILHLDSMLERLMPPIGARDTIIDGLKSTTSNKKKVWKSVRYKAHDEDFSNILWPEKFTQARLEAERQDYLDQGYPEGYAQEYLNYPIDDSTAYFRKDDFRFEYDFRELGETPLNYYSAIDFAISQRERADYTAIVTVGIDSNNKMYVVDARKGRWDGMEIIEEMFNVHMTYQPELFTTESGAIEKALGPFLRKEMQDRGVFINLHPLPPIQDKPSRAKSIQARLRQGNVWFDKEFEWYNDFEAELRHFPRGAHDDYVDAFAWIGLTLAKMIEAPTRSEWDDELWEEEVGDSVLFPDGRCMVTGY